MRFEPNRILLYRNLAGSETFRDMCDLINRYDSMDSGDGADLLYRCVNRLAEFAGRYGFGGNIWQKYLACALINDENAFTLAAELDGDAGATLSEMAYRDLARIRELYLFDLAEIDRALGCGVIPFITEHKAASALGAVNDAARERISSLADTLSNSPDSDDFFKSLLRFYKSCGVGKLGLNKAFRVERRGGDVELVPIVNTQEICLADIIGYEDQKQALVNNTADFVGGRAANNVLLYGDSGTGKSSSIKAVLNEYYDSGLRMIEVFKHQLDDLDPLIEKLKTRRYKFIIYMDDLSFEENEVEYKYLKAFIEGGLEVHPQNVLVYATSNRRHLVRENWSDTDDMDGDRHVSETMQEKLSLAHRFGLSILYFSPSKKQYFDIVKGLAKRFGLNITEEHLLDTANRWGVSHGGYSGRTARQLINYLAGSGRYN